MLKLQLHKKDTSISDWRKPTAIPEEVLTKQELDHLEHQVIDELQANGVLHPQALFYIHKYIDAKFDKNNFDVDAAFAQKQSIIDELYAEGLSEVYTTFARYRELMSDAQDARANLITAAKQLNADVAFTDFAELDDTEPLSEEIDALPTSLAWHRKENNNA